MSALTIQRTLQLLQSSKREERPRLQNGRLFYIASAALACFGLAWHLASQTQFKVALACGLGALVAGSVYFGKREAILRLWNTVFAPSQSGFEQSLASQFQEHQLRGGLLRCFCLLSTEENLKLAALAEMNFAQLSEVRTALGQEVFNDLLKKLTTKKVPHQLWLGIHEFMAADLSKMKELLELQKQNAACDWFSSYTRVLAGELSSPAHQEILQRLIEIAPHLTRVSPYMTISEGNPAEIATARRVARHCQSLSITETLDEWIADLKFAAAKKDPGALRKIEQNFDQLNTPLTFENLKKIVQGYIGAKYSSERLDEFKRELVKLYTYQEPEKDLWAGNFVKRATQNYQFACNYECSEFKEEIYQRIVEQPIKIWNASALIILLGEDLNEESFKRLELQFALPYSDFRAVYAHFIQRDTPTGRYIITWLTDLFFNHIPEEKRLGVYAPHETPVGLRPPAG